MSGVEIGTDMVDEEGDSSSKDCVSTEDDEEVDALGFEVGINNTGVKEALGKMGEWSSICKFWDDNDDLESSSLGDAGDVEEDN